MNNVSRLRPNALNFPELLAQAIALISPTMTAALIVPLVYASSGNGSWLAYAFGTVMLLFVALNLNQFARRSSAAGSMYGYARRGLGPTGGALSGWCLIWAYMFIGMAGLTGFTVFALKLLGLIGIQVPAVVLFSLCASVGWYLAYRDVQLSTILMLVLEAISVTFILILAAIVLTQHGFTVDRAQLTLQGSSFWGMGAGVVGCIFSLVGFECATAFGEEARNPLQAIPRAVVVSLILTGLFFVVITYIEVFGLSGYKTSLANVGEPLNVLATISHVSALQVPISLGAMVSFFSLFLSCVSAGSRISFAMGRQGIFPAVGRSHSVNQTPHIAVTVTSIITFLIPAIFSVLGAAPLDLFGYVGTMGAFGFLFAYILITIAAPMYLRREGELRTRHIALAIVGGLLLIVPAVGSVYPVPAPPANLFPYLFLAYFLAGATWFVVAGRRAKVAAMEYDKSMSPGDMGVA